MNKDGGDFNLRQCNGEISSWYLTTFRNQLLSFFAPAFVSNSSTCKMDYHIEVFK